MSLNKILRAILLVGVFSVTMVPLFVSSSMYFPFITGKNFAFRIVVEIMLGLWLVLAYRDKQSRPKKSWLLVALTLYLLIEILATIFSQNPTRSFWSNFERMEGLLAYLHSYIFFVIAVSVVRSRETWRWLLNTTVMISSIISFYALGQLMGKLEIHQGSSRLDATLGNSAYMATYMLFHIFILAYLFFTTSAKDKILRYIYAGLALFELIILYFTATRGAILGLIGGVLLLLSLTAWKRTGQVRKMSIGILGILIVGVTTFWFLRTAPFIAQNPVLGRFASISLTEQTTQSRFLIWNMSLQGFKEHPMLGWGPENYPLVFQKYYSPEMWKQEPWFDRSHNVVLDNLINFGLLGLLAYLSVFITAIYYLWRKNEREDNQGWFGRMIITCLLAAYFFQNIFVFDNLTSVLLFYIILGYIHTTYGKEEFSKSGEVAVSNNPQKVKQAREQSDAYLPIVIIVAVLVSSFSLYYFSLRSIDVSKTLISAISQGTPETKLLAFNKIFSYGSVTGQTEAREQLINVTQSMIADKNVSDEIKMEYFSLTEFEMKKQNTISPDDARMHLLYGSFLSNFSQSNPIIKETAIKELTLANQLSPKKQVIMFELGSFLLNNNQVPQAVILFKQAFEEDQTYSEARKIYALVLLYTKNISEAKKVLGDNPEQYIKGDSRFDSVRSMILN